MMKKTIKLTETDIHNIIKHSINEILTEAYNSSTNIDWDSVNCIKFRCWYDNDDLQDAINDGEIENNDDGINEWMYDNLFFDMEFLNSDYETLGYIEDTQSMMDTYGIPDDYIELIVNTYKKNPKLNYDYRIDDVSYEMANQMDNVEDACKRMFETADTYSKGMHGFILKNGTIILMPPGGDHNNITSIHNVEDKWSFIEDGNPSILDNNLRVGSTLTYEQQMIVGQMIRCYSGSELYVSFLNGPKGEQSCRYAEPNYQRVIADINRYYDEGIIPRGDGW